MDLGGVNRGSSPPVRSGAAWLPSVILLARNDAADSTPRPQLACLAVRPYKMIFSLGNDHESSVAPLPESISQEKRSWIMSRVGAKNTPAELRVRRVAHGLGLRFRLYHADLPGKPDIVFPRHRVALFVHGCFWHRHRGCNRVRMPQTNKSYWRAKFRRNTQRDQRVVGELASIGWRALVLWECETTNSQAVAEMLRREIIENVRRAGAVAWFRPPPRHPPTAIPGPGPDPVRAPRPSKVAAQARRCRRNGFSVR